MDPNSQPDDAIDFAELLARFRKGVPLTLGFALIGLSLAGVAFVLTEPFKDVTTTSRIVFSFVGYERGLYPDESKFSPDDLRSPEVIASALKRQGLEGSDETQSRIRAALTIEGIITPNIIKERDRLRAAGQTLPALIPDEYQITLSLPRKFPLTSRQRELLLNQIVSVYRENFTRTYVNVPLDFGNAFETLKGADFFEYELILNLEVQNILAYLNQQLNIAHEAGQRDSDQSNSSIARTFRSQATNLSFSDLIKQTQLFTQIRLNETLGLIRQNGLSKNRAVAMVKMDYYLRNLEDQELKAVEEESVVRNLLAMSRERSEGYVLGIKSQVMQSQPSAPLLDQGLIDSLLANDASNFLIREALKTGLKVKGIQAEKAVLLERRKNMQAFLEGNPTDQSAIIEQVQRSLAGVEEAYRALISNIRKTHEDYEHRQYANAVRVSMQARTTSFYRSLAMAGIAGLGIGGALGVGLSLVRTPGSPKEQPQKKGAGSPE